MARGGLLDYNAVVKALESGQLGGLAMDVAWSEPYDPSDPILKFPNVLITPHVAGVTTLSYENMGQVCDPQVEAFKCLGQSAFMMHHEGDGNTLLQGSDCPLQVVALFGSNLD